MSRSMGGRVRGVRQGDQLGHYCGKSVVSAETHANGEQEPSERREGDRVGGPW